MIPQIIPATLADEAELLALAQAFHVEDGHPLAATAPAALRQLLAGSPLGRAYLVKQTEKTLGYFVLCFTMSIEFGGMVVILDDLYLRSEHRGRGIGGEILSWIQAEARRLGAVQIFLEVENLNERAFGFYQRRGFLQRDRRMMERNF